MRTGSDRWTTRSRIGLGLSGAFTVAMLNAPAPQAQSGAAPAPTGPVIEDLVAANHVLAVEGILDAFGHVSARHPANPSRYLMSRSLAPELVTAADIMEFDIASSDAVDPQGRAIVLERFIHGEIYKARPDVQAVVHSHSQAVIPFGIVGSVPLRPVYHMSGFLYAGVPIYDIRADAGLSDMLIRNVDLGRGLARTLGDKSVALLRGHGNAVVGDTIPLAVYRAIYTDVNARLQMQALSLGGPITYLDPEEGRKFDANVPLQIRRAWELWKSKASSR